MEESNKVNEPNWELVAINRRQDARVFTKYDAKWPGTVERVGVNRVLSGTKWIGRRGDGATGTDRDGGVAKRRRREPETGRERKRNNTIT